MGWPHLYGQIDDSKTTVVPRGFTETECRVYFPDSDCPTLEEVLAG